MIKGLILALQFLTRIPINIPVDFNKENIRKSIFFFPFIGMLIGTLTFLIYKLFLNINNNIASVFAVLFLIIITGGLHLDGLSDMADGFFSNKSREDILIIMKDSRVGAFGVISLIIIILLKYVLISSFTINPFHIFIFSLGNSRLCQSYFLATKKSAKPDGLGDLFLKSDPKIFCITGIIIYLLILGFVNVKYLIPTIITFLFSQLISAYSYKKIGGISGDILGATAEISEVVSMISFLGVINWI